jgi:hypothetical protein
VIVTLSSSEQSSFISYFFHQRSTGDQHVYVQKHPNSAHASTTDFFGTIDAAKAIGARRNDASLLGLTRRRRCIRFAHGRELIEAIGPINLIRFIADVNPDPSVAHEIGGLKDGPHDGAPNEFRMIAVWAVSVDCKCHRGILPQPA